MQDIRKLKLIINLIVFVGFCCGGNLFAPRSKESPTLAANRSYYKQTWGSLPPLDTQSAPTSTVPSTLTPRTPTSSRSSTASTHPFGAEDNDSVLIRPSQVQQVPGTAAGATQRPIPAVQFDSTDPQFWNKHFELSRQATQRARQNAALGLALATAEETGNRIPYDTLRMQIEAQETAAAQKNTTLEEAARAAGRTGDWTNFFSLPRRDARRTAAQQPHPFGAEDNDSVLIRPSQVQQVPGTAAGATQRPTPTIPLLPDGRTPDWDNFFKTSDVARAVTQRNRATRAAAAAARNDNPGLVLPGQVQMVSNNFTGGRELPFAAPATAAAAAPTNPNPADNPAGAPRRW